MDLFFDRHYSASSPRRGRCGFSLIELLVVIAIIGLMAALAVPALSAFKGAGSLTKSAAEIAGTLEQARSYAMAQNTYVFVGLYESDGSKPDTERPAPAGTGRVWMGVVASKDGTKGYDPDVWQSSNLVAISKLKFFENLHLMNATVFATPGMAVSNVAILPGTPASSTGFGWPVDTTNTVEAFGSVIQFDPQGGASLPGTAAKEYIEIDLRPTHADRVDSSSSNAAVIQLDCITGRSRSFRP